MSWDNIHSSSTIVQTKMKPYWNIKKFTWKSSKVYWTDPLLWNRLRNPTSPSHHWAFHCKILDLFFSLSMQYMKQICSTSSQLFCRSTDLKWVLDTVLQVGSHNLTKRDTIPSLDLLVTALLVQPRIQWTFCAASVPCQLIRALHQVLHWAALNRVIHAVCIDPEDCSNSGAGPCSWSCWTSWPSHGPTPQLCQGPPSQGLSSSVCCLHHSAWYYPETCWGCTQSHNLCH